MSTVPAAERVLSFGEAERFVKRVEAVFRTMELESIVELFASSAVVRFPFAAPIAGRAAIEAFLRARYADISDYSLSKELVAVHGCRLAVKLRAQWRSAATGARVESIAMEVLTVERSRIAEWEAVSVSQPRPVEAP
jgi:nuclear transport factor 2 (NTF2) superfamily protein